MAKSDCEMLNINCRLCKFYMSSQVKACIMHEQESAGTAAGFGAGMLWSWHAPQRENL